MHVIFLRFFFFNVRRVLMCLLIEKKKEKKKKRVRGALSSTKHSQFYAFRNSVILPSMLFSSNAIDPRKISATSENMRDINP